jgi:hypothetical protein
MQPADSAREQNIHKSRRREKLTRWVKYATNIGHVLSKRPAIWVFASDIIKS